MIEMLYLYNRIHHQNITQSYFSFFFLAGALVLLLLVVVGVVVVVGFLFVLVLAAAGFWLTIDAISILPDFIAGSLAFTGVTTTGFYFCVLGNC